MSKNIFEIEFWPQFRDADADGTIGLRGIMNYFQDITSHQMYDLKYGNYILGTTYNKVWFITKYKLKILNKIDFADNKLTFKSWIEDNKSPVLMYQSFSIERNGQIFAYGKVELCLVDIETKKLSKLSIIEFPDMLRSDKRLDDIKFEKIKPLNIKKDYCYTHKVKFNDIDQTGHMNNLAYVALITNTFDVEFYEKNNISEFTINYLDQCFEGENVKIYKYQKDDEIFVFGEKENNVYAFKSSIKIVRKEI